MKAITAIRRWLCRHTWRPTKFQALVPGWGYECTRCGKQQRFYSSPPATKGARHDN